MKIILEGENILSDNYPVFFDYIYLVDSVPVRSDIQGTVLDLKKDLISSGREVKEIRNCDIFERQELFGRNKKWQKK